MAGGAADDSLTIPDLPGVWELSGVNTGTYTASSGTTVSSLDFQGIENLVGATNADETYDFLPGGSVTGSITDGTGLLTIGVLEFGSVTGTYDIVEGSYDSKDTLEISGSGDTVFAGLSAFGERLGIEGNLLDFAIAILTDGTSVWQTMSGSFDTPSTVGLAAGDFVLNSTATFTIGINSEGTDSATDSTTSAIDYSTNNLTVGTETFTFAGEVVSVSADPVVITLGDFVHVAGSLSFEFGGERQIDVETLNLDSTELSNLDSAYTGTVNGTVVEDLPVTTTLIGIGGATVFTGYSPSGFPSDPTFACGDLSDAFGFCADGIDFGMVFAKSDSDEVGFDFPNFFALRGEIATATILGFPSDFEFDFTGIGISVNPKKAVNDSGVDGDVYVDWEASFPGSPAGLEVPTGSGSVYIAIDDPIFGVSADLIVISLSDFVHVSGSFAFEAGGQEMVDIDIVTSTITQLEDVTVETTTVGIGNGSVFVGYNPSGTDPSFDPGSDDILTADDLDDDALGLLLSDIDLGIVFATPDPTTQQDWDLPDRFWALKANVAAFELVNLLPDEIVFDLDGIQVIVNGGGTASSTTSSSSGEATINWVDSYPTSDPYAIPTGTTTDPVELDFSGSVIGVSASFVQLSISKFVHISGGFSFLKGKEIAVDIQTNDPTVFGSSPIAVSATKPSDGSLARTSDGSMLWNVPVETIEIGIADASFFVGYNDDGGDTFDLGGDQSLDEADLGDAIGFFGSGIDLGMVFSSIVSAHAYFDTVGRPTFVTVKGSADIVSVLGLEAFLTLTLEGVRAEVNFGDAWATSTTNPPPPAIDWESSFTGGYDVDTGEGNDPVTFTMDGYLIGGGADLFVLGIGEFIHLRGSAYFEMGRVVTVPLVSVVDLSEFEDAFSQDVLDLINVTEKTLRFLNFGAQDVYAFVGIHGPHWITEDPNDLTSDIVFECDPDYSGTCDTDPSTGTCATDDDPLDGHADAEELDACRAVINEDAIGIAVSALDFAFAMGTPVIDQDPTRFYTLRASLDLAALIGLEDAGLTASLEGVEVELNIATPTISGFPILPVIDWEGYALRSTADGGGGCTQGDLDAGEPYPSTCEPFAVKTGRIDPSTGEPVVEYFLYDTLLIRAAVELARIDVFGVLAARGSLAFVLGPVLTDVELIDG
ncbi:MAG: hypothetical protein R3324_02030, partial [Halobacteriales archaeon]|nr:hypothetical protein [Halobacteriales archaeon]